MDAIEEYPFLFMNTPSSLQLLASTKVALMLWQRRCAALGLSYLDLDRFRYWFEKLIFSCEEILIVRIPSRIKSQIDDNIFTSGKELLKWQCFHASVFKDEETRFSKCIKHIVLDFSGKIGYKATALNILNSAEFADVENYRMACLYSLEDHVRRFWPLVSTEDLNDTYDTCNLSYWNGVMESGENSIIDGPTKPFIERWMELANRGGDAAGFEDFYQMLPDYEYETGENPSIFDLEDYEFRAAIRSFPSLNRIQVEEVFREKASAMFGILAMDDDQRFLQFARQSWNLVRHLILDDEPRFFSVLYTLWKIAFCPDSFMRTSHTRCDEINELLVEIWSDASDELKAAVSDNYIYEFFERDNFDVYWMSSICHSHGHDMKFMIDLLNTLISRDMDKAWLWRDNWHGFALRANVSDFEQLISSCLVNNEDEVKFYKNCLLDFEHFFRDLIGNGFYSDLRDYLYFCSKDPKHFQLLAKKELESNLDIILIHNDDEFAKFEWFVGELFSNEKKDVDEFKAQMISSAGSLKDLLAARRNNREIRSNDFSTLIGRFATAEDEYNLVKRNLLEQCRSYPMNCSGRGKGRIKFFVEWIEFLEWCIPDPEEHSAFKQSCNVDEIFLNLLRGNATAMSKSSPDKLFLDEFLSWYFGNEEDSKNFKLDMIKKNYTRIDFVRTKMLSNRNADRREVSALLRWFFDNNTEDLCKFCESCNFILYPNVPL
ncbi:uncharacterized protein LOC135837562 [Planococcus citri]|uniref:uncharacterized protein LOC135837562 n=1 Tax=Planococcus citri TaxID=170843 RepID=UPI0031FA3AAA